MSDTLSKPRQLLDLVARAQSKANANQAGRLSSVIDSIRTAFRLLKAYAVGSYRDISLESLALIVASVIYFVMPLDALPDFILSIGFIDDAALLAWTFRSVSEDIERFVKWEQEHDSVDVDS